MGCCPGSDPNITPQEQFGVVIGTPCTAITVDLLQIFKKMIDCYIQYGLWGKIGSSEEELTNARDYLQNFITQKIADPNDCTGVEMLYIVRQIADKIIKKGACL